MTDPTVSPATAAARAAAQYQVSPGDLPLHCPTPQMSLWDTHPRVFLPIEENGGYAKCPYCGAEYRLRS